MGKLTVAPRYESEVSKHHMGVRRILFLLIIWLHAPMAESPSLVQSSGSQPPLARLLTLPEDARGAQLEANGESEFERGARAHNSAAHSIAPATWKALRQKPLQMPAARAGSRAAAGLSVCQAVRHLLHVILRVTLQEPSLSPQKKSPWKERWQRPGPTCSGAIRAAAWQGLKQQDRETAARTSLQSRRIERRKPGLLKKTDARMAHSQPCFSSVSIC